MDFKTFTQKEIDIMLFELELLQEASGYNSYFKNKLQTIIDKLNK